MHQARVIDWGREGFVEVRPGIFGATVHTPQLTAVLYRYSPDSAWEEHRHPQDQVTAVIEGAVDFIVDGVPVRLTPGQLAMIPGGVAHSATVPASGAVTLNILTHRDKAPNA